MRNQPQQRNANFVRRNEQIRIPRVLLVKDGQNLGVFPTYEALRMAKDEGLDLVEVAPTARPPVCHIMEYGKFKFEESKKQREKSKNQGPKEREVQFRYVIDDHDLETKIKIMERILADGDKLRLVVRFKARENAHRDQGMAAITKCIERLGPNLVIERQPTLEGKQIIARLARKKVAAPAAPEAKPETK